MDFHLATPTGDVYLFSSEDGRTVQIPSPSTVPQANTETGPTVTEIPL